MKPIPQEAIVRVTLPSGAVMRFVRSNAKGKPETRGDRGTGFSIHPDDLPRHKNGRRA